MNELIEQLDKERKRRRCLWDALKQNIQDELDADDEFTPYAALRIIGLITGKLSRNNEMERVLDATVRVADGMVQAAQDQEEPTA